ncbi:hypothetical protein AV530_009082 [Patagioenas fasciata monilis]|uniref:Uncharacterized protein n=1 Tax=Patagioenas fasciata monilis TaxID=372326 RepID=A0A1V4L1S8_PATFA|nr:hypothetical protein AV530_009082 [Patagioenas fasciata monilis]
MGLEPLAMVQGQPLYPTGSYQLPVPACPGSPPRRDRAAQWVQGPPVPRTLPSSAQEPGEASNKDRVAIEENIPAASPHQSPLAPSACTTTMEPTAPVPTPAALERLVDQPKQEPEKASVKAAEQVEDTTINDLLTWLDTLEREDAVPDVPDSPGLTTFLSELPDLSEYVAEGGCAKQRVVAVGLGDSEDAIPDVPDTPNLTTCLNNFPISPSTGQRTPAPQRQWRWRGWRTASLKELHDFSDYAAENTCSQDQGLVACLEDSRDTSITTNGPCTTAEVLSELPNLSKYVVESSCPKEMGGGVGWDSEDILPAVPDVPSWTTSLNKLPRLLEYRAESSCQKEQVVAEMLLDGENVFADVLDGLISTISFSEVPGFLEYGTDDDYHEARMAAAMLEDTDTIWGVRDSPLMDPQGQMGTGVMDLPSWPPMSPLKTWKPRSPESSEQTAEDTPVASPWKDPQKDHLHSSQLSPLQIPLLSCLASPPHAPQCPPSHMDQLQEEMQLRQIGVDLTRWGEAGSTKAKRPAPASTPNLHETSPEDNNPPKKRRK